MSFVAGSAEGVDVSLSVVGHMETLSFLVYSCEAKHLFNNRNFHLIHPLILRIVDSNGADYRRADRYIQHECELVGRSSPACRKELITEEELNTINHATRILCFHPDSDL